MRLSPHLCFDGNCAEAFRFYQKLFGGSITSMLTYGESALAQNVPLHLRNRILHATLQFGSQELLGADVMPEDYQQPAGFFVILSVPDLARARETFDALSEAGSVRMPIQKTFWSDGFGVLVDRFGIPWEVSCERNVDSN